MYFLFLHIMFHRYIVCGNPLKINPETKQSSVCFILKWKFYTIRLFSDICTVRHSIRRLCIASFRKGLSPPPHPGHSPKIKNETVLAVPGLSCPAFWEKKKDAGIPGWKAGKPMATVNQLAPYPAAICRCAIWAYHQKL